MSAFSKEQLQYMLDNIGADPQLDGPTKHNLIRALQNQLANLYLIEYLGGADLPPLFAGKNLTQADAIGVLEQIAQLINKFIAESQ